MSNRDVRAHRPLRRIFAMPLAIGVLSAIGLVGALLGDGLWDALGWFGLGVPLAITLWCVLRPSAA